MRQARQARTTQPRGHVTQLSAQQPPDASREEHEQSGPDCYPPLSDPYPVPPTLGVFPVFPQPSGPGLGGLASPERVSRPVETPRTLPNQAERRLSVIPLAQAVSAPLRPSVGFCPRQRPGCSAHRFLPPSLRLPCSHGHPPATLEAKKPARPLPAQHSGVRHGQRRAHATYAPPSTSSVLPILPGPAICHVLSLRLPVLQWPTR